MEVPNEIDNLEIVVEASAGKANKSLSKMEKHFDKIADSLSKIIALSSGFGDMFDSSGAKQMMEDIDSIFKSSKKASKQKIKPDIDRSDLKYTAKSIDELFEKFKDAGKNADFSDMGMQELQRKAKSLESTIDRLYESMDKKQSVEGTDRLGKTWESLVYDISKATNQLDMVRDRMSQINAESASMKDLKIHTMNNQGGYNVPADIGNGINQESTSGKFEDPTKSLKEFMSNLDGAGRKSTSLREKIKALNNELKSLEKSGYGEGDDNYDQKYMDLVQATQQLKEYKKIMRERVADQDFPDLTSHEAQIKRLKAELSDLSSLGYGQGNAEYDRKAMELARVTQAQKEYNRALRDQAKSESESGRIGVLQKLRSALKSAKAEAKGFYSSLKKGAGAAASFGSKMRSLSNSIKHPIKTLGKLKKAITGARDEGNKKWGLGRMIKSSILMSGIFQLISAVKKAIADGSKNLVEYGGAYASSINSITSSLNYLKNSWAAAFAPIVNVVAPYLNAFLDMISSALNAVGKLLAALTGKGFAVQAKKISADVGDAGNSAASGLGNANDAAKELKRTLMGFDQINKLDDPTKSSGSGSGSGGSGSGGTSGGDYFTTVPIDDQTAELAQMIKEAWENADFTELGEIFGNKINEALADIPWDTIQTTMNKIAKSIATFLNGAVNATDWDLVGSTIAQGINTAFGAVDTFLTTFDFGKFGKAIATALNSAFKNTDFSLIGKTIGDAIEAKIDAAFGFVETFDWKQVGSKLADAINSCFDAIDFAKAGKALSDGVKGILTAASTAIEETDWEELGKKIGDFLKNIDWLGIMSDIGKLICNAITAGLNFAKGLIDSITDGIKNLDWSGVAQMASELFGAAWEAIKAAVEVGISLAKLGWTTISKFVGDAVSVAISLIKKAWTDISDFVGNAVSVAISLIKSGWTKIADFVGNKVSAAISLIKSGWKSLSGFVGDSISAGVKLVKSGWKSLSGFVGSKVSVGIKLVKSGWSSLSKWLGGLTQKLNLKLPKIKVEWSTKKVAGFEIKYPSGFKTYATGGFPEEGPFMMNRGEIAGKFSNGKSVVANNKQITDGIAQAVGPAVYSAVVEAMNASGGNGGNVRVVLEGDAKKVFRIVKTEADNYTASTGKPAFAY